MAGVKAYAPYRIGERVFWTIDDNERGAVVERVPQAFADDLYRVAWDSDPASKDTDLYSQSLLAREATA
jgi:hypothetical protein